MIEPTCVDLRPWAKQRRYRWRYEESYHAEKPENRGDGSWYVEVLCKHGIIYPKGGKTLLAYASPRFKRGLAGLGFELHQTDGDYEVFASPPIGLTRWRPYSGLKDLPGVLRPTPSSFKRFVSTRFSRVLRR